jgi:hypothetical protein
MRRVKIKRNSAHQTMPPCPYCARKPYGMEISEDEEKAKQRYNI